MSLSKAKDLVYLLLGGSRGWPLSPPSKNRDYLLSPWVFGIMAGSGKVAVENILTLHHGCTF